MSYFARCWSSSGLFCPLSSHIKSKDCSTLFVQASTVFAPNVYFSLPPPTARRPIPLPLPLTASPRQLANRFSLFPLPDLPKVTDDGDIMYVFRGLASTSERNAYGTTPDSGVAQQWKATVPEGGEAGSARPEVMLFEVDTHDCPCYKHRRWPCRI